MPAFRTITQAYISSRLFPSFNVRLFFLGPVDSIIHSLIHLFIHSMTTQELEAPKVLSVRKVKGCSLLPRCLYKREWFLVLMFLGFLVGQITLAYQESLVKQRKIQKSSKIHFLSLHINQNYFMVVLLINIYIQDQE